MRGKKGRVSFKKKGLRRTGSILVWIIIILPPNSGEDLKKQKRSSPQTGYVLVQISGILPPNFGEHQKKIYKKKGLRRKSGLTLAGISD